MSITLTELEQEVARRVGPFYLLPLDRQAPTTATFQRVFVPALRSTIDQDTVTSLWLLRRGVLFDGSPTVQPVEWFDRQRLVASYTPQSGAVDVERPWSSVPEAGELVEFHHLDPLLQLREVVHSGLRRTRMDDRFSLGSGYIWEADLTASLPWLTSPRDVYRVESGFFPTNWYGWGGPKSIPFVAFTQSGHVCIRLNVGWPGAFFGEVVLTVGRSHFYWVNGQESLNGPTDDNDTLDVDLGYAVAAAHIEAWHQFPSRLQAAAAGGLQATQQMAALEFTRQALIHAPRRPDLYQMQQAFGMGGVLTVVNA